MQTFIYYLHRVFDALLGINLLDLIPRFLILNPYFSKFNLSYRLTPKKKKTEPIQILLNLINIIKISTNFVDLNINFCTIIPQSFSYFCCFTLTLCIVQNILQMGAAALEANLQTSRKIVTHSNTFLFETFSNFCCI